MYEQEENEEKEIQKRQNIFIISFTYLKKIVKKNSTVQNKNVSNFYLPDSTTQKG